DRAHIEPPAEQAASPRTSDMAWHIGKIAESLQRTCCRVFHALTAWHDYEVKVNAANLRLQIAGASNLAPASIVCPWMSNFQYRAGATLEDFSTWMRDDILFWAMSRDNCKRYWLENDAPTGCDLPLLPEAGGNARLEPAAAREAYRSKLRRSRDRIMASTDPAKRSIRGLLVIGHA
ncbi:unnamed protein product, partial [Prorocentrum cordatum]